MSGPVLLDLFAKAGGAAMGYSQAGFDVYCLDVQPQRRNPFPFCLGDALAALDRLNTGMSVEFTPAGVGAPVRLALDDIAVITASPPCWRYSRQTKLHGRERVESHPDLAGPVRDRLVKTGLPYVIENVEGAPLRDPLILCGSMWGQERLRRHRLFESSLTLVAPGRCRHEIQHDVISVTGKSGGTSARDGAARFGGKALWQELMGIGWMSVREMAQAVPPAYIRWIGVQMMAHLGIRGAAA